MKRLEGKTALVTGGAQGLMPYARGSVWYRVKVPAIPEENVGLLYPSFLFTGPRLPERAPKCDKVERLLPGGAVEE